MTPVENLLIVTEKVLGRGSLASRHNKKIDRLMSLHTDVFDCGGAI